MLQDGFPGMSYGVSLQKLVFYEYRFLEQFCLQSQVLVDLLHLNYRLIASASHLSDPIWSCNWHYYFDWAVRILPALFWIGFLRRKAWRFCNYSSDLAAWSCWFPIYESYLRRNLNRLNQLYLLQLQELEADNCEYLVINRYSSCVSLNWQTHKNPPFFSFWILVYSNLAN